MDLSILDQSPGLRKAYTQLCFCYPFPHGHSQSATIETLNNGLEKLTTSFTWLAGQVVLNNSNGISTGSATIQGFERFPRLVVKDFTNDQTASTWDEIQKAGFPYSMLDEKVFCPRSTIIGGPGETFSDPIPVFLLQANFIRGGLILSVLASHSVMDMGGQGQVIRLLSKACRDETFSDEEIFNVNLDRRHLVPILDHEPLLENHQSNGELEHPHNPDNTTSNHTTTSSSVDLVWVYFSFSRGSLADLKEAATSTMPHSAEDLKFVSTDDALCALIWQSVARARSVRLDSTTETIFTRAVDMRRYMNVSTLYPGNMAHKTSQSLTIQELATESIGVCASRLRSALNAETLKHELLVSATKQAYQLRHSNKPAPIPNKDRTNTITMSSWSNVDCYEVDVGLGLGPPVAVRRPRFQPIEGVAYLLPKAPNGEIVAGLCLREEDMERFRLDEVVVKYGNYIG